MLNKIILNNNQSIELLSQAQKMDNLYKYFI